MITLMTVQYIMAHVIRKTCTYMYTASGIPLHTSQYHRFGIDVANDDTTALDSTTAIHNICIYFFLAYMLQYFLVSVLLVAHIEMFSIAHRHDFLKSVFLLQPVFFTVFTCLLGWPILLILPIYFFKRLLLILPLCSQSNISLLKVAFTKN